MAVWRTRHRLTVTEQFFVVFILLFLLRWFCSFSNLCFYSHASLLAFWLLLFNKYARVCVCDWIVSRCGQVGCLRWRSCWNSKDHSVSRRLSRRLADDRRLVYIGRHDNASTAAAARLRVDNAMIWWHRVYWRDASYIRECIMLASPQLWRTFLSALFTTSVVMTTHQQQQQQLDWVWVEWQCYSTMIDSIVERC